VKVHEEHARELSAPREAAAALLDHPERMWPTDRWPAFRPDGFGFLRHELAEHRPGERIVYRITGPRGLSGEHGWTLEPREDVAVLRHTVDASCRGLMQLGWPLVVQPIHAAVHEDALDRAETLVGGTPAGHPWSRRVRVLRWTIRKAGRSRG
jgi:hypothetical protein